MSIFKCFDYKSHELEEHFEADDRHARDALVDVKAGFDMLFELKQKIDKLHPAASEILYRVMMY